MQFSLIFLIIPYISSKDSIFAALYILLLDIKCKLKKYIQAYSSKLLYIAYIIPGKKLKSILYILLSSKKLIFIVYKYILDIRYIFLVNILLLSIKNISAIIIYLSKFNVTIKTFTNIDFNKSCQIK